MIDGSIWIGLKTIYGELNISDIMDNDTFYLWHCIEG